MCSGALIATRPRHMEAVGSTLRRKVFNVKAEPMMCERTTCRDFYRTFLGPFLLRSLTKPSALPKQINNDGLGSKSFLDPRSTKDYGPQLKKRSPTCRDFIYSWGLGSFILRMGMGRTLAHSLAKLPAAIFPELTTVLH